MKKWNLISLPDCDECVKISNPLICYTNEMIGRLTT